MGYKIISKKKLSENLYELKVFAPYVVKRAQAGQFIIIRTDEEGERVPLTIADIDKEKNELTMVFMAVGYSTKNLALLNEGEEIKDVAGPLGLPTEVKNFGTVVCVAGGYGAAPAYLISKAFKEAGNKVYIIVGARNAELIFWRDKMKSVSDKYFITTDDGSLGKQGLVTGQLAEIIKQEKIDHVMAIGPVLMMKAVADLTKAESIYTTASMNTIMVDGTGMCGSCRLTVNREVKFACVDGPDFDAHKVDFDEIIKRISIYKDQERCFDENCRLLGSFSQQ
ncbi:MAG TPA: sulfide/dihydroorotate dehydrogenase-like FAD/NAD-binding protein [Candidatus Gastranaerophilales bacterium]|nr:sulfide/dihydroorotate dehydrogenase-like FAD/NAD-binding protein [Candidatus Gastranaerophilales bacterium]